MESSNENIVYIDSRQQSRITTVNIYTDRAQITRIYKINVPPGRTQLRLTSLPTGLDCHTIRVNGRGGAKIESVLTVQVERKEQDASQTSPLLQRLMAKKAKTHAAWERCQKTVDLMHACINEHALKHIDNVPDIGETLDRYNALQKKWEAKLTDAAHANEIICQKIEREHSRIRDSTVEYNLLRTIALVGVYRSYPSSAELEIVMTYMVLGASWKAGYNIQVRTQIPVATVGLTYQAFIVQETGEDWNNVVLILETAIPTVGFGSSGPWTITHQEPPAPPSKSPAIHTPSLRGSYSISSGISRCYLEVTHSCGGGSSVSEVQVRDANSTNDIGTTIEVHGLLTIPTDNREYCVKIADLELEAKITWTCAPKSSTKVYLEAEIINSSQYTLLPGQANVFAVDQSLIACPYLPAVSPKEVFKCRLGADASVRVTYYRREHDQTAFWSGFRLKKQFVHTFTQRASIRNTKSIPLCGVRMTDYIPVSDDPDISVTLISPALALPNSSIMPVSETPNSDGKGDLFLSRGAWLWISEGIRATWKGADSDQAERADVGHCGFGQDGTVEWFCDLPPFSRVDLLLQWEVATTKKNIDGL